MRNYWSWDLNNSDRDNLCLKSKQKLPKRRTPLKAMLEEDRRPGPHHPVFLWSVKAFIQESKFAHDYTSLSAPVHSEDVPILCEHLVCLRLVPGHRDHGGLGGIGGYLLFRFYTSNKYSVYNIHVLTVVKWFSKWGLRVLLVRRSPIPRQGRKRTSRKCRTRILATYQPTSAVETLFSSRGINSNLE